MEDGSEATGGSRRTAEEALKVLQGGHIAQASAVADGSGGGGSDSASDQPATEPGAQVSVYVM